jgi:hypothetical protein
MPNTIRVPVGKEDYLAALLCELQGRKASYTAELKSGFWEIEISG